MPLHARGFDASLFHDGADSRLVNLVHDWRPGHGGSAGLEATRYDRATRRLVGEPEPVVLPPGAGWIEGPNLYRRGPWYYLLTADGGTGYDHQVTVARSRTLTGPYERDPAGPLITARHHPDLPLQKAGHGSLVDTPGGLSYLAYLVARPYTRHGPCVLGRETALAPVTWTPDGWPRAPGGLPALEIPAPAPLVDGTDPRPDDHDDVGDPADSDGFDRPVLGPQWSHCAGPGPRLAVADRPRLPPAAAWRPLPAEPHRPQPGGTPGDREHAEETEGDRIRALGFTGAFVGFWAWDLTGGGLPADFDEATYRTWGLSGGSCRRRGVWHALPQALRAGGTPIASTPSSALQLDAPDPAHLRL